MFKTGDWCFHEFNLKLIKGMKGDTVEEVSDGWFNMSGNNLTCFPLTLEIKVISDNFKSWEDIIRKKEKETHANINWPGIHGRFEFLWAECCKAQLADKKERVEELQAEIERFAKKWEEKLSEERSESIDGVPVFRT